MIFEHDAAVVGGRLVEGERGVELAEAVAAPGGGGVGGGRTLTTAKLRHS